jgi:hypothetical protein
MATLSLRALSLLASAAALLAGCDSFLFFGDSEENCDTSDLECYCELNPENCSAIAGDEPGGEFAGAAATQGSAAKAPR